MICIAAHRNNATLNRSSRRFIRLLMIDFGKFIILPAAEMDSILATIEKVWRTVIFMNHIYSVLMFQKRNLRVNIYVLVFQYCGDISWLSNFLVAILKKMEIQQCIVQY